MAIVKKEYRISTCFKVDHIYTSDKSGEIKMSNWVFDTREKAEKFIAGMEEYGIKQKAST